MTVREVITAAGYTATTAQATPVHRTVRWRTSRPTRTTLTASTATVT